MVKQDPIHTAVGGVDCVHCDGRQAAAAIKRLVADAGDTRPAISEFTPNQIEMLAELEHRRWLAERRVANWTFGTVKDEVRRENPNLLAWEKLEETVKDYDRKAVRLIPPLLAGALRKIVRRSDG